MTFESRTVYRQLFDAQVKLSSSLFVGCIETRTGCLSAEDSITHSSTGSSRGQQQVDSDIEDVSRLPQTVVVQCQSSDIIRGLTEKRRNKHDHTLRQMEMEITELSQVCETQVTSITQETISSLQDMDDELKKVEDEQLQVDFSKMKEDLMCELKVRLSENERHRVKQLRALLRKYCHLLEKIGFLLPPDVHRLIHNRAMMLNQALLVNRRSSAHLLLLLCLQHQVPQAAAQ